MDISNTRAQWGAKVCSGPKRRERRERKPTPATIIKQAKKLGVDVTVAADGSMTLRCGAAAPAPNGKGNSWDDLEETGTRQ